jgi:hypothetical protein
MVLTPVSVDNVEVSGGEKAGVKLAGKAYDKLDGLKPDFGPGDVVGSEAYVAKAKAALQAKAGSDQIGHDSGNDGMYAGKSTELGKGGRSEMLQDRITLELVEKGKSLEDAIGIAKAQAYKYAVNKFGAKQVQAWSDAAQNK